MPTDTTKKRPKLKRTADGKLRRYRSKKELFERKRDRQRLVRIGKGLEQAAHAKYRIEFAPVARIVCAVYGSTVEELAKFFRVQEATIYGWFKDHPEFRRAVEDASVAANMNVMQRLYRRAMGFSVPMEKVFYDSRRGKVVRAETREYYPPSEIAQIFWLKNRMPDKWKDRHELTGKDGSDLAGDIYNLFNMQVSPDAALETYNELLKIEAKAIEFKDKAR